MRMFTMRQDMQIKEEDGNTEKDISVQVHIHEDGFHTGTILGMLDNVMKNTQVLIMDECNRYNGGYENSEEEYNTAEGWDML